VGFIERFFGGKREPRSRAAAPVSIRARYDAAESGDDRRHWAAADAFSQDAALAPTIRRTIRNRARYERQNNSYLSGIAETVANDLIGTGPRLQLSTGSADADREIERGFFDWSWRVHLASKLRTMRQSKMIDGEAFAVMFSNPALDGVQLDLRLVECDQVSTPTGVYNADQTPEGSIVDGMEFDAVGNVVAYKILKNHPGSNFRFNFAYDRVSSANVFHWFTAFRPAQHRGVSEVAPCLRLFADLRRYTAAVIAAAETAADFAAFLHSNSPAAEVDSIDAFQSMDIEKRSLVTLPEGWDISQLRAEQPTANFGDFRRNIISEIGRCLQIPYNIAALDSSNHNYASGRMDAQLYHANQRVTRDEIERSILDRLFAAWCDEAVLIGAIPGGIGPMNEWDWAWTWDGREHVDPAKEASAAEIRLRTYTTTLASEYARQGKSWEAELRQRAAELALIKELGLPPAVDPMAPQQPQARQQPSDAVYHDTGESD
jgi:lambda family phage portal protein